MIEILDEYKQVDELVKGKAPLIFVTGGGGTGKSTFIKWLSDKYYGRVIKCAPTGIAALNISGKTIHSVFRLPPKFITKEDIKVLPSNQAKVIFNTDVIIIDEISMVTSNMLDAVDLFLQANMRSKKPFGGKTVIIVGDMFQLPPIVGTNVSDVYFKMYDTAYFIGANVMKQVDFEFIELQKVRRQKDDVFIDILSNIRTGQNIKDSIDLLNDRCRILIEPEPGSVVLSPRNNEVEARNNSELKRIRNVKEFSYDGTISGEFKNDRLPSPFFLDLKVGAQVSFTANLKEGIVNGTVGKVVGLYDDKVQVQVLSTSEIVTVEKYTWEEFTYKFNEYKKQVESKPCGTYEQIPLKLAWASTIHKCVSKDTLVETPKGKVAIENINIGDYVNTGYGYRMVTNKWNSGVKKSFKIKTKLGYELICSDEHKLLTYVNYDCPAFKELKNIDTSHKIAISTKTYEGNDDWYHEICDSVLDNKSKLINIPKLDFDNHNDVNISLDIYYDSIDSITADEDVEMYDIEVDDHHSFVANNIIVHNCQGVTLDKVHIDLGAGCFATGQLYVALSRCRTLDSITLSRKLTYDDVSVDDSIISFYEDCRAGNQDFSNTGMSELFV